MYSIMTLCIIYSTKPLNIVQCWQCYTIMHLSIVCDVPFIGYNTVTMFFHRSAKTAPLGLTPPVSAISQLENLLSSQAPPKRYYTYDYSSSTILDTVYAFVGSCLATKVFIGNLPAMGRGWVIIR